MFLKLAWRGFTGDRARFLTAVAGIAAASGLVVWHVGLATTACHSGDAAAIRATSPFSAWVTGPAEGRGGRPGLPPLGTKQAQKGSQSGDSHEAPQSGAAVASADATAGRRLPSRPTPIQPPLLRELSAAPGVTATVALRIIPVTLDIRVNGRVLQGPPLRGNATALPDSGIPFNVGPLRGRLPDDLSEIPEVAVCTTLFGSRVPVPDIGSALPMILSAGTAEPVVTGIFDMSGIVGIFPSIYANKAAMDQIAKASPEFPQIPNLALFQMADSSARPLERVLSKDPDGRPRCRLYSTAAVASRFRSDAVDNLLSSLPMTLCLSLISASCLVATVLLIGLAVRRRRIAEFRCAGMTRLGVARLFLAETMLAVVSGWLLGTVLAALALLAFLHLEGGSDLPATPYLGWIAPAAGLAVAALSGIFASMVPVMAAIRVKPLEAFGEFPAPSRRVPLAQAAAVAALLAPMALVSVCPWLDERTKALLMGLVGLPCFVASLFFAMHPLLRLTEWIFLLPLSSSLGLEPALLRNRLSREPSRVAGMVVSIALGLGGFVAVHVWGSTLMSSFVPSPEWPDAIVSILPNGLSGDEVGKVAACPGVEHAKVVRIDCTQKPFGPESPAFAGRDGGIPKGPVLLFGADPDAAFAGDAPFAPFRIIEGDREAAIAAMREGKGCIAVAMLARLAGLHVGDEIDFAGRRLAVSAIADVNWHMVTSRSLVRTSFGREGASAGDTPPAGRTIGTVFVSEKFVRGITGNDRTFFLWLGMTPELDSLGGLQATVRLDGQIRAAVKADGASAIQVHHRDEIADGTLAHGSDILGIMARIPFWSLVVSTTGMVALLLASVQGSMMEFRMMRAVGMTRGAIARLILGESMLVALAAVLLGFLAGLAVGWSFTGLSRWMAMAGLPVRLVVPFRTIAGGIATALALCLAMSLLPLSGIVRRICGR